MAGGASLAIAAAYAWWTTRHPDTPIRFLIGPAAWLGVGVALAATRTPMPTGPDVARADAWQAAGMAIAIAASVDAHSAMVDYFEEVSERTMTIARRQ